MEYRGGLVYIYHSVGALGIARELQIRIDALLASLIDSAFSPPLSLFPPPSLSPCFDSFLCCPLTLPELQFCLVTDRYHPSSSVKSILW